MAKTIPPSFAQQAQQAYNQALAQRAQHNPHWAAQHAGQQAQHASPSAMLAQQARNYYNINTMTKERYMIDGVSMDFDTFINTLYPEDCAEKTFMILKLKKE
jgi:hypothetical protein